MSIFSSVTMAPADPIFSLAEEFRADPNPHKLNLVIGVYFDEDGKIPVMRAVETARKAKLAIATPHNYLPIEGMATYRRAVQELLFDANSELLNTGRVVTIQTPGGSGALKIGADFLRQLVPNPVIAVSDPTWDNHTSLFGLAGFQVIHYPYYDAKTHTVRFDEMCATLNALPPKAAVLLHACCHNPTGVDLTREQWQRIIELCQEKQLIPFLDVAYQGFAQGLKADRIAVDMFAQSGLPVLVANSFSKNFALYGERVGALSIIVENTNEAECVFSLIKRLARVTYSNPPTYGASLVAEVLTSPELRQIWETELTEMRMRIHTMRSLFSAALTKYCPTQDFSFIDGEQGLFSFLGLSPEQVARLRVEHSVYLVGTSRICVAALTHQNIEPIARAIKQVLA